MQKLVHIISGFLILCLGLSDVGGLGNGSMLGGGAAHAVGEIQMEQAPLRALTLLAAPATSTIFLSQKAAASIRVSLVHLDRHIAAYYASKAQEAGKEKEKEPTPSPAPEDDRPVVYLTFDDGPSKNTPKVLDILSKNDIKGTFFVLGEHARPNKDTLRRIVEEGHSIGNHTYNHRYKELYGGSFSVFADQVLKTNQLIYEITGVHTMLFRAPGGTFTNFDDGYWDAMESAGYRVHDWNVDSGDSLRKNIPAKEILQGVKKTKLAKKMVVLMHDSGTQAETVKALPEIIKYFQKAGYRFDSLTEEIEPIQFRRNGEMKWKRGKVDQQAVHAFIKETEQLSVLAKQDKEAGKELSIR